MYLMLINAKQASLRDIKNFLTTCNKGLLGTVFGATWDTSKELLEILALQLWITETTF